MNIRRDDTVVVLSGKDKGKQGKIIAVVPDGGKVVIEGVNIVKRHQKPRKQGEEGGIMKKEAPIYASKVMRVCPKCSKPTKAAFKFVEKDGKTNKVRVCKQCGAEI